jgi:hypothetical protein
MAEPGVARGKQSGSVPFQATGWGDGMMSLTKKLQTNAVADEDEYE